MKHGKSEKQKKKNLTLAKEERSSAIVDKLKRNENEKAFLGTLLNSIFLIF